MDESTETAAPIDETIRAHIARAWQLLPPVEVHFGANSPDALWEDGWLGLTSISDFMFDLADMRASEIARLDALVESELAPLRDATTRAVNEALVRALTQFLTEHPDVPRRARVER